MTPVLTLEGPALERALPFRATFDAGGQPLSVSPSLRRYWALGDIPTTEIDLRLRRPFRARLERRYFGNLTGMSLDLGVGEASYTLHGELLELPSGHWLLVGMPDVRHVAELESAGILMGDLPAHMGLGYLLLATEATALATAASAESTRQRLAAEAASRAKAEFVANMSHELRTPLTAIMGFLRICLQDRQSERQQRFLQKAQVASQTLLTLIGDVLDFSKIEARALTLDRRPFEVADLVSRAQALFADSARTKGLDFQIAVSGWPPPLVGDENRIGQVLNNLLGNAIKFTAQGYVRLSIVSGAPSDDGVLVEFRVGDTGIGIPTEQLPLIMSAFHQADVSTTRQFGGTGLGLAISDQLVTLMGGKLVVESTVGQGTTFSFALRLPLASKVTLASATDPAPPTGHSTASGVATAPPPSADALHGARVLLVEDNATNQEVIAELLGAVGAITEVAGSGGEAVRLLAGDRPFDLVLMDVQMPEMDGMEATRRTRQLPHRLKLPVIALTANARLEDRARCLEAGMDDFELKPVDPERLYGTLRRWLTQAAPAPAPAADVVEAPPPHAATVDRDALSRLFGNDQEKMRKVVRRFTEVTHSTLVEMEDQLARRDIAGLSRGAHYLRGAAATIRAGGFADLCEDLETACEAADLVTVDRLLQSMHAAADRVLSAVEPAQDPLSSL